MAASQARATARHLHLVRAAQSAGEAFAYASPEEVRRSPGRGAGLAWISLGLVALAALVFAF